MRFEFRIWGLALGVQDTRAFGSPFVSLDSVRSVLFENIRTGTS